LSTLTKILVVLLAFSSIFLCGIVVTYVASTDNYKQKLGDITTEKDNLSKKVKDLTKQVNDKTDQNKQLEEKLNSEMAALKSKADELDANLKNAEREKAALLSKVDNLTSVTKEFYETNDKQGQLLKSTVEELKKVQFQQVDDRKMVNDAQAAVAEKAAVVEALEAEKRNLMEEKAALQAKLDKIANPGKRVVRPSPVAPKKEVVNHVTPGFALEGTITAVDVKNSMASISVGKNAGVKEGMKFHVTRGDEFICDIQIIDVEGDEAVGMLELVQKQPQVGDAVTTNL